MASITNIFIDQGATFSETITVKDTSGNALNLTGYTSDSRNEIYLKRVAPIQISYLGYSGTMNAKFNRIYCDCTDTKIALILYVC